MSVFHFCALLFASAMANDMKFDYQISEGQARFKENIVANLERNTVEYHTPAHNDVLESYKMLDFNKKMQITCLPSLRQCRLRGINVEELTGDAGTVAESFVHSWNKGENSIDSQNSKAINELYYIDNEEVKNTIMIGEDLRKFYENYGKDENGGFPLYKEKKLPENAVLLNITRTGVKRNKRAFNPLNNDCGGQQPVTRYGVDSGRSCNYLKICEKAAVVNGQRVFADCNNVHITSPLVYVCVCCPGVTEINLNSNQCACTKMNGP